MTARLCLLIVALLSPSLTALGATGAGEAKAAEARPAMKYYVKYKKPNWYGWKSAGPYYSYGKAQDAAYRMKAMGYMAYVEKSY